MSTMKLKNIKKHYGKVEVLHDINLDIKNGEFVVLIGSSGCGKSTLLRMISGLEEITEGELIINDKVYNQIKPQNRNMAMVFQSYALYPHMTVYDNMAYGLKIKKVKKSEIETKIQETTKFLNINQYLQRLPKNLSGGQRQRVAMGRAIVRNPDFFLFDEPLSNLDAKLRVIMRKEIKLLHKRLKTTTVYVTHDQIEAMTLADKIVLMDSGYVVQLGSPKELFDKPNSIFTASFLGSPSISLIDGIIKKERDKDKFLTKDGIELPIRKYNHLIDNQEVVLGIRPRDFILNENGIKIQVNLIEYTGSENLIYGNIGKNEVNLVFSRKENFDSKNIMVKYDIEKCHLFDKKTKKVIN